MRTVQFIALWLGIVVSVVFAGCDGVSEFDRTNPDDPESETFVPDGATGLTVTPMADGTVRLRWAGDSQYADGTIVEKSVGDEEDFERLATVTGNDSTYVDTTRQFERPTVYRVRAFAERGDERNVSDVQTADLSFGRVGDLQLSADVDGTIHLAWADRSRLEAGFEVEVSIDGGAYREVAFVDRNEESYSYQPESLSFADTTRKYRVTVPLLGSSQTNLGQVSQTLHVRERFAPTNLSATDVDEETVRVTWQPQAQFASEQLLTKVVDTFGTTTRLDSTAVSLDLQTTDYTHEASYTDVAYSYALYAVDEAGNRSTAAVFSRQDYMDPPELTIASKADPAEGVNLSWSHAVSENVTSYTLVRSPRGQEGQTTWAFGPETTSYVDTEVDPATRYRYRIRTTTSTLSDRQRAAYLQHYGRDYTVASACGVGIEEAGVSHLSHRGLAMHPRGSSVAMSWGTSAALIDVQTGEEIDCLQGPGGKIQSVAFSPEGTLLSGGASSSQGQGEGAVIWEVNTGSTVQHFDQVQASTVAFGPNGEHFGATGGLGKAHVWRTGDWEKLWVKGDGNPTYRARFLAFSSDGQTLAMTDYQNQVELRNARTGGLRRSFSYGVQAGTGLLYVQGRLGVSKYRHGTQVIDPEEGSDVFVVPGSRIAVSPSEDRIGGSLDLWDYGGFGVWSARTGAPLGVMRGIPRIEALALAPTGSVFTATEEGVIRWVPTRERWMAVP